MKRKVLLLISFILVMMLAVACSSDDSDDRRDRDRDRDNKLSSNLEKSRLSKDTQNVDMIYSSIQVALADENAYSACKKNKSRYGSTFTLADVFSYDDDFAKAIRNELSKINIEFESKAYKDCDTNNVYIDVIDDWKVKVRLDNGKGDVLQIPSGD